VTAVLTPAAPPEARLRREVRRWACALGAVTVLAWSLAGVGLFSGPVLNPAGLAAFSRFASAAFSPATDATFLRLLAESTLVTLAYAALGAALAVLLGAAGALVVARTTWGQRRLGWRLGRGLLAVPRGLHEAVWGLLLLNVLGLDPWVAVLAIGLPYGAVTAKVFADLLDEVPHQSYDALRAAGAGQVPAALYGLVPPASGALLAYACYRVECAVRSAAVLGLIGAGGLGYQLALSFVSLRWEQLWSAVYALALLCLLAEVAGRALRRRLGSPRGDGRSRDPVLTGALAGALVAVIASWWWLALAPSTLVSERAAAQFVHVVDAAWPPDLGVDLLRSTAALAVDTVQMSVVAVALATVGAVGLAGLAARPTPAAGYGWRLLAGLLRIGFLLLRAVPPPVWALVLLFVLLPGPLPGALALGVYTLGVLGRLVAEAVEEQDRRPASALTAAGARPVGAWLYGVLPGLAGPALALALYRWEVAIRDTVLVGLLGAGGIGVLLSARIAAFDWAAVTLVLAAIVLLTYVVDLVSDRARTALR
jgi:phosphonate transport system permease protein